MAPPPPFDESSFYKHLKGTFKIGNLNISYDLTEGLSEEQWVRMRRYKDTGMYITKSGKIIIPKMGIY